MSSPKFEKIVINYNEGAYSRNLQDYTLRLKFYQTIIDDYNLLGIENKLLNEDLPILLENPKEFLASKIMNGEEMKIGSLKIKAESFFEMIEKPENYITFLSNLENKTNSPDDKRMYVFTARMYGIQDGKTAIINPAVLDQIKEQSTTYINTENQKKAFDLLTEVCLKLNDLKKLKGDYITTEFIFNQLIERNGYPVESQDFSVNPQGIENF